MVFTAVGSAKLSFPHGDGEEYDPDVRGPLPAVWEHPAARQFDGCPVCFGAGTVIGLGDI